MINPKCLFIFSISVFFISCRETEIGISEKYYFLQNKRFEISEAQVGKMWNDPSTTKHKYFGIDTISIKGSPLNSKNIKVSIKHGIFLTSYLTENKNILKIDSIIVDTLLPNVLKRNVYKNKDILKSFVITSTEIKISEQILLRNTIPKKDSIVLNSLIFQKK